MEQCWAPHLILARVRVLYIGRAAPTPSHGGLEAIQKPLHELYTKTEKQRRLNDRDGTLFVLTSGLMLKPLNPLDDDLWLPIQDMEACLAIKGISDRNNCKYFAPIESPEARCNSNPPILALIMKRGKGMKISDCYAFVCESEEMTLSLARKCARSFSDTRGWATDKPNDAQLGLEMPKPRADYEKYVDDCRDDCPPEFYEKPSLSGFFYAPRSDLIQKFSIKNEDDLCAPPPPAICQETCYVMPPPPPQLMIADTVTEFVTDGRGGILPLEGFGDYGPPGKMQVARYTDTFSRPLPAVTAVEQDIYVKSMRGGGNYVVRKENVYY